MISKQLHQSLRITDQLKVDDIFKHSFFQVRFFVYICDSQGDANLTVLYLNLKRSCSERPASQFPLVIESGFDSCLPLRPNDQFGVRSLLRDSGFRGCDVKPGTGRRWGFRVVNFSVLYIYKNIFIYILVLIITVLKIVK